MGGPAVTSYVHWVTSQGNENGVAHAVTGWWPRKGNHRTACGTGIENGTERLFRKRCAKCIRSLQEAITTPVPDRIKVEVTVSFVCNNDTQQSHVDRIASALQQRKTLSDIEVSGMTVTAIDPASA